MEDIKRPKKAGVFTPHQFWLDGQRLEEIGTFHDLASKLVQDSMSANDCRNDVAGKLKFIELWQNWYRAGSGNTDDGFVTISWFVFRERKVAHKYEKQKLSGKNRRYVVYCIKKILENFIK